MNEDLQAQLLAAKEEAAEWERQALYHNKKHGEMLERVRILSEGIVSSSNLLQNALEMIEICLVPNQTEANLQQVKRKFNLIMKGNFLDLIKKAIIESKR